MNAIIYNGVAFLPEEPRGDSQGKTDSGAALGAVNPFQAVKAGDYVWSENPETHEKALKKVKKIFVREKDSIIRLSINGETIENTAEHPFYVEGKGFVEAKNLKVGDEVRTEDGAGATVEFLE